VRIVRAGDVHEVDVLPLDHGSPVGFDGLITPVVGKLPQTIGIARDGRFQHGLIRNLEKRGV